MHWHKIYQLVKQNKQLITNFPHMKSIYLTIFALFSLCSLQAQTSTPKDTVTVSDSAFTRVEIESSFPGGDAGWLRYLRTSLVYPEKAVRKKVAGTVVVQFIVEKDGSLSDIKAISGPELLQQAAINVIKDSPGWKPAVQHGRKVKSYKKQPITFQLQ